MTTFVLLVTKSPFDFQQNHSALRFCKAAISAGHNVSDVFFYSSGVATALKGINLNGACDDLITEWQTLAKTQGITLKVCSTAAERRGLASQDQEIAKLNEHFELAGMLEYFAIIKNGSVVGMQF